MGCWSTSYYARDRPPRQTSLVPSLLLFVIQREDSTQVPLEVFLHEHPVHSGGTAQRRDGVSAKRLDDGERHGCQERLVTATVRADVCDPSLSRLRMCPSHRNEKANIY